MNNIIDLMKIKKRKTMDNVMREIGSALAEYLFSRVKLILTTILFEGIEEDPMERIFVELVLECKDKLFSDKDFLSKVGTFEYIQELDIKIRDMVENRMKIISEENKT